MPKVETLGYRSARLPWQTTPQAIVRFLHVPEVEILIPTEDKDFLIAADERASGATFVGIHHDREAERWAQCFHLNELLHNNATFQVDLLARVQGEFLATEALIVDICESLDPGDLNRGPGAPVPGAPTQTVLCRNIPGSPTWIRFQWFPGARPILEHTVHYWVRVRASYTTPSDMNWVEIGIQDPGNYGEGFASRYDTDENTWQSENNKDLVFKVSETVTSAIGGVQPALAQFSRDFSTGPVTAPTRPILECIAEVGGNTQTVEPWRSASTQGTLTVSLVDVAGEVFRHCGSFPMKVNAMSPTTPGPGDVLFINEPDYIVDMLPSMGTLQVLTNGVIERIRYDQRNTVGHTVRVLGRGVDTTVAAAHAQDDLATNGEEIRQGQRCALFLSYEGLGQADAMLYGVWEVIGRRYQGTSVIVTLGDPQIYIRKTVFLNATPQVPYRARGRPIDLLLMFLLSTGTGQNGGYDVFPADASLGLPQAFVDVEHIRAVEAQAGFDQYLFDFSITALSDGKDVLVEQFLKPLGCYPFITQRGQLSIGRMVTAPNPASVAYELTEDDVIDFEGPQDGPIINQAVVEYDFDLETRPGDFGKRQIFTASDSVRQFGRRQPWTLRSWALKTADGAETILGRTLLALAQRYATTTAPPLIRVRIPYRQHTLEIGDYLKLTHSMIPNPITGVRGITTAVCEVQDITPMFLANGGGLQLTLLYVGGIPTLTGGFLPGPGEDLGPVPPPPPTGLELVIDGVGQGNSHVFWGKDIHIRWNAVTPPDSQEPLEGNPQATGPTVEGYWILIYQPDGLGALTERRRVFVVDPAGIYPYEANAADNGGVAQRTITGRWFTQLRGGLLSLTYSEFTAINQPPSMTGFIPLVQTGVGSIRLDWSDWPEQFDLDRDRYQILYATSADPDWTPGMGPNKSFGFVAHPGTFASITGLPAGLIVRMLILPWDVFGYGAPSDTVERVVPGSGDVIDTTPPADPAGLIVSTGRTLVAGTSFEGWVEATWTRSPEPDVTVYRLRTRVQGSTEWGAFFTIPQASVGETIVRVRYTGIPIGLVIESQILAEDRNGNRSNWVPTPPVVLTVGVSPLVQSPTGLVLTTGTLLTDGRFVSWGAGTWYRNTEPDLAGYTVRVRQQGSGTAGWGYIDVPQPSSGNPGHRVNDVPPGLVIDVQVSAYLNDSAATRSPYSPEPPAVLVIAGEGAGPATPTGFSMSTGAEFVDGHYEGWVFASWALNTEPDILEYFFRYRVGGRPDWEFLPTIVTHPNASLRLNAMPLDLAIDAQIAARDRDGHASGWSATVSIVVGIDGGPTTPTGLIGTVTYELADGVYTGTIQAFWNPNPELDLLQYNARARLAGTSPEFTWFGSIPAGTTTYRQAGIPLGTVLEVQLQAQDRQGHVSPWSGIGTFVIGTDPPPATPTGLAVGVAYELADGVYTGTIQASWNANTEPDFFRYNARARLQGASVWTWSGSIAAGTTAYRQAGLPLGITLEIALQAEDRDGHLSAWCTPVLAVIGMDAGPAAPIGFGLSTGVHLVDGQYQGWVYGAWTPNTEPDIQEYTFRFRLLGRADWEYLPTTVPHPNSSLRIESLPLNLQIEAQVAARDRDGHLSAWSATVSVTIGIDGGPIAPTGFSLATGVELVDGRYQGWIYAVWNQNPELDIQEYTFRYRVTGGADWEYLPTTVPHPNSSLRIPGLPLGLAVQAQVAARDRDGHLSPWSATASITVGVDGGPATPTGITYTTSIQPVGADGSYLAQIEVSWNANPELDLLQYNARARLQGDTTWTWSGSIPAGTTIFRQSNMPTAITIEGALQAQDRDGHLSAWSTPIAITTASVTGAPSAVTGLVATAYPMGVRLVWDRPNMPDLDHFEIHESATTFTPTGTGAVGNGTCIGHTGGATHERSFPPTSTYPLTRFYRVIAVRTSGTRGASSNEASAVINGTPVAALPPGSILKPPYYDPSPGTPVTVSTSFTQIRLLGPYTSVGGNVQIDAWVELAIDTGSTSGAAQVETRLRDSATIGTSVPIWLRVPQNVGPVTVPGFLRYRFDSQPAGTYNFILEGKVDSGNGAASVAVLAMHISEFSR